MPMLNSSKIIYNRKFVVRGASTAMCPGATWAVRRRIRQFDVAQVDRGVQSTDGIVLTVAHPGAVEWERRFWRENSGEGMYVEGAE